MRGNAAKIRPKSGRHTAIPSNYAVVRGLPTLYSPPIATFSPFFPTPGPDREVGLDRQADRVRGPRPGAGVGHAIPHIGGSPCVCRLFAEYQLVFYGGAG